MNKRLSTTTRVLCTLSLIGLLSACGTVGSPQQLAQANAVHAFDENRAPYGQRLALAEAGFRPQVYGLNPYFGR